MVTSIRDVLQKKGDAVYSIAPEATVYQALELMATHNIGALVVMDKGAVIGIVTERDYARKVILRGRSSPGTTVADIMTSDVCYVTPDNTIEEGLAVMTDKHCRHLPVIENDNLAGLVSIGDLVKAEIAEKDFIISQLENYIQRPF